MGDRTEYEDISVLVGEVLVRHNWMGAYPRMVEVAE
jgi:hypothetical protein